MGGAAPAAQRCSRALDRTPIPVSRELSKTLAPKSSATVKMPASTAGRQAIAVPCCTPGAHGAGVEQAKLQVVAAEAGALRVSFP